MGGGSDLGELSPAPGSFNPEAFAELYGRHERSIAGDSAAKAGFDCLGGNRPRLLQRTFLLVGPTINSSWKETDVTYAWDGPHLVKIGERTFSHRGLPATGETKVGAGCVAGIG